MQVKSTALREEICMRALARGKDVGLQSGEGAVVIGRKYGWYRR